MVTEVRDDLASTDGETERIDEASAPFVGKWNRLVSQTNWEKGRIICQWREALVEDGAAAAEFADEAWARRVGGVSAQHVGRLRRVWQRFGNSFEDYEGLYWSHFLVAMDWSDAEMWLEGAARSGWSVSQMRAQRWEALGAPDELKPREEDVFASDWDEDSPLRPVSDALRSVDSNSDDVDRADDERSDRSQKGRNETDSLQDAETGDDSEPSPNSSARAAKVRPFAELPELPDDVAEAFEQFKIVILAHKMKSWQEIPCAAVLAALDSLKALALAPTGAED